MYDIDIAFLITFSCQSYEGGIGGFPGNEAHGGYTFCGLAAAVILRAQNELDLKALLVMLTQNRYLWHKVASASS